MRTHSYPNPTATADDARSAGQLVAQQRAFDRYRARREERPPPPGYERPAFNTPQYWRDCARGWVSGEEQLADQAAFETRRRRAIDAKHNTAPAPARHSRPAPRPSRQFAKPMATTAARDDRLTPQAKALLQVLVARTGRGDSTDTTKTTLGRIMSRCPRSIQRYLRELVKLGYLRTQTIKSRRTGFYVGLRIWLTEQVLPFWGQQRGRSRPPRRDSTRDSGRNREETKESPTNLTNKLVTLLGVEKPPWGEAFVWR